MSQDAILQARRAISAARGALDAAIISLEAADAVLEALGASQGQRGEMGTRIIETMGGSYEVPE